MIDLISERVGGRIVECNDEFFAAAENLLLTSDPVWREDEYTDRGKWMDGWETRRRRQPGHDWVVIRLGIPGRVRQVTVDTSHFTGNYPQRFSLEGAALGVDPPEWVELIPESALDGDAVAFFDVTDTHRIDLVRFNIYPDGGVARLRVEGEPLPGLQLVCPDEPTDLASAAVGGEVVEASDIHYSHPANCLRPTTSAGMWDGWETRRRRDDGHDWMTVRLGLSGVVERLVVDTTHFKGNAPGWVSADTSDDGAGWRPVVERAPVDADRVNTIVLDTPREAGYVRLSIHPDGGVARFRVVGRAGLVSAGMRRLDYVNFLLDQGADRFFNTACAADAWVSAMRGARPYGSIEGLLDRAEVVFEGLAEPDWLEAFAGHPRIGERGDQTSEREQSGTFSASRETIRDLIDVNRRYEDKFGFTYIVYATGKTADEMLAIARDRLGNDRDQEIANAASEQRKITATRLRRMLCQEV